MPEDLRKTLKDNVQRLLLQDGGPWTARELSKGDRAVGITRLKNRAPNVKGANPQRILEATGKDGISLRVLALLAEDLGLHARQLLQPGMDPVTAKEIADDVRKWPMPRIRREDFMALSPGDRDYVQGQLSVLIANRGQAALPVTEVRQAPNPEAPANDYQAALDRLAECLGQFPDRKRRYQAALAAMAVLQQHLSGESPARRDTSTPTIQPSDAPRPRPKKRIAQRPLKP